VAGEYPWPANSGSRLRLLTILRGLRRCGPTDLFSLVPEGRSDFGEADQAVGLARVGRLGVQDRPRRGPEAAVALVSPRAPFELSRRDADRATRAVARFRQGRYDLVWYFGIRPWALVGGLDAVPTVVDLVDLEDHKIAARLATATTASRVPGWQAGTEGARRAVGRLFSEVERRRWAHLQQTAAASVTATVVCSRVDRDRLQQHGAVDVDVVPNAYDLVDVPSAVRPVGTPPTVLFQGTLRYPPNADAARFLVDQIRPSLATEQPDVRLRLVGVTTPALSRLHDPPRVTLTGSVESMVPELARADLVVVPVRFGSGTRLKILEAFAHRIPVASTSLGCEGLDVEDGVHLLVSDTADGLARACGRLLEDPALRQSLTDAAHHHFAAHYESGVVEAQVEALATRVALGPHRIS
jgi:glycosyltransferase involved in cell wall biosynthesis